MDAQNAGRVPVLLHGFLLGPPPGDAGLHPRLAGRIEREADGERVEKSAEPDFRGGEEVMNKLSRVLVALSAVLLARVPVTPIWRIGLVAPQYPEGLGMVIRAHTVQGAREFDLKNINELNHYIGMKVIEPDAIPELRIMPWIIGALAVFALVAAAVARRGVVIAWLVSVATLGVVGMVDFYKWEYDFGHNLDLEHAIIKIPGMSYQPPLIGTKQLLNFTAASWPSVGAILAGAAPLLGGVGVLRAAAR